MTEVASPYPDLARRRSEAPVHVEEVEATPAGPRQWYGVYGWAAVRDALRDDSLSAGAYDESMGLDGRYGPALEMQDEPEHRRHRAVLQPSFAGDRIRSVVGPMIRDVVDEVLAGLDGRSDADLLTELCRPIPPLVLAGLFGLPATDAALLDAQSVLMRGGPWEDAVDASDRLKAHLAPVFERRRAEPPGPDLPSVCTHGRVGDRPMTDDEAFSHLRVITIAGTDTLARSTGNLLVALLGHPDQLDAVRRDRGLVGPAVDEALRWEGPAIRVPRVALRTTAVAGTTIPAGSWVLLSIGSANRDPARWSDPDRYDLHRERKPHLGFGIGTHVCIGAPLARAVMAEVLVAALDRLPDLRPDPAHPAPQVVGLSTRGPDHLRALWG